jgi:dynein heavy chain
MLGRTTRETISIEKFTSKKAPTAKRARGNTLRVAGLMVIPSSATKASREVRQANLLRLDARHSYVLGRVAEMMGVEQAVVDEAILDPGDQINLMDSFFAQDQKRCILFLFSSTSSAKAKDLVCTDGTDRPFTDSCVYCIRPTTKAISTSSMAAEICFGLLRAPEGRGGLLDCLAKLLSRIMEPALRAQESWGRDMTKDEPQREAFMNEIAKFRNSLEDGYAALSTCVTLSAFKAPEGSSLSLSSLTTSSDFARIASDPVLYPVIDALFASWIKEIHLVLIQNEQMRKEADNVGPRVELEHWKVRMSRFNSLRDQLRVL